MKIKYTQKRAGSGSGNGEDGEDEAVVMVFNGEIGIMTELIR